MKNKRKVILTSEQIKQINNISKNLTNDEEITISQSLSSGIGITTYVKINKEKKVDITDYSNW